MNSPHTRDLFIFFNAIREAREAAAPISNATANDIANQLGFDSLKKSITWIVEITLTIKYKVTNVPILPTSTQWLNLSNNVLKVNFATKNKGKIVKIYNNQNGITVLVGFTELDKFGNGTITLKIPYTISTQNSITISKLLTRIWRTPRTDWLTLGI